MSTNWGFHCEDCYHDSPTWFTGGAQEQLRELLKFREAVVQILDSGWLEVVTLVRAYDEPLPAEFLKLHVGHSLLLSSEYGERITP